MRSARIVAVALLFAAFACRSIEPLPNDEAPPAVTEAAVTEATVTGAAVECRRAVKANVVALDQVAAAARHLYTPALVV
jgi:hypothetical protein